MSSAKKLNLPFCLIVDDQSPLPSWNLHLDLCILDASSVDFDVEAYYVVKNVLIVYK